MATNHGEKEPEFCSEDEKHLAKSGGGGDNVLGAST